MSRTVIKLSATEPIPTSEAVDFESFPKPEALIRKPINGNSGTSQTNCVNTIKKGLFLNGHKCK
jgi:hypothetical protein